MPRRLAVLNDNQVIDYFLDSKTAQGCTADTLSYYRYNLCLFQNYLQRFHVSMLGANNFHITNFIVSRTGQVAPSTLHIYYRSLRTFYNWCIKMELRSDNPMAKVQEPKLPHKIITPLSIAQINTMLKNCGSTEYLKARNYALLLVMLDTGIRRSEVVAMKLQDIDWRNSTIKVHGKGRREGLVPFDITTSLALKRYLLYHPQKCDSVWLTEELTPLSSRGIQVFFRRLKDKAGIEGVRCSAHTMRHTCACMLLENGASMKTVQDLLRHADMASTEIYAETRQIQKAISEHQKASPVANLKRRTT